jgi:iron complex outermembrane recepter protein
MLGALSVLATQAALAQTLAPTEAPVAPAAAASEPAPPKEAATAVLDGVVVRSRKPLQAVKDVPQSVSVVAGEDLKQDDAASLEAITKRLSNVKWNYGNSQTSNYSIRGLGKIANSQSADPSVGLYVDGIAYAYNPLGSFDFYDVDTVAVSRGPQGFSFGKNATIGAIQVKYKRPSFVPSTEVAVGFNKYEKQSYGEANGNVTATAVATGPIEDGLLAYRTSLRVNKGGGWILNSYNTDNQYISSDRVSGRLQVLLTPSADFDARLGIEVNPRMSENANIGSTNFFFGQTPDRYANGAVNSSLTTERRLARPWFTRNADYTVVGNYFSNEFIASDTQQGLVTGSNGLWVELNWALNDQNKLTSITAFKDYYFNAFRDDEGTVFDVQSAAGNNIKYSQYSQELRLVSRVSESVNLTSGLFALKSSNDSGSNAAFGSDAGAWFATNAQYNGLDTDAAGRLLLVDSLADLWRKSPQVAKNKTLALYGSADWKLSDQFSLNTGARLAHEDRRVTQESKIIQQGYGRDLNAAEAGGFVVDAGNNLTGANSAEQLAAADRVALRYFGVANYAGLSVGQRQQVALARAVRNGRVAALYAPFEAERVRRQHFTWSVSPSYKIDADSTAYLTLAHGEKSGVPGVLATTGVPTSYEVRPEKNNAIELGFKSILLQGTLTFNTAVFVNDIKDYQQTVSLVDEVATAANGVLTYVSAAGNVPKVRAKGLEVDAAYSGIRDLELRVSGAYNDARYVSYPTAALPVERANEGAYYDASGKTLPGASKYTLNVGVSYRRPVLGDKLLHTSWNTSYASRFNSDNNLSEYAWIRGHSTTDVSLGLSGSGGKWDVNFYVKNLFDDDTPRNVTWNAWAPSFPRLYGLTFTTKL